MILQIIVVKTAWGFGVEMLFLMHVVYVEVMEPHVLFLHSLTGTDSINGRLGRPETVPSGLEVDS